MPHVAFLGWADEAKEPVAVRYAWAAFLLANLYNEEGLPTGPLGTDKFPPLAAEWPAVARVKRSFPDIKWQSP